MACELCGQEVRVRLYSVTHAIRLRRRWLGVSGAGLVVLGLALFGPFGPGLVLLDTAGLAVLSACAAAVGFAQAHGPATPQPPATRTSRVEGMTSGALERATNLLDTTILADGHNDLAWELRSQAGPNPVEAAAALDLTVRQPSLQTDFPKLAQGKLGLQFWSVYVPCQFEGDSAVTAVLEQVELVHQLAERYPDRLRLVDTAAQAEAAFADGRIASLLGAEGGHSIAESLGVLRSLRRLGVRYMTLTHNLNTTWADSGTDEPAHGGLTEFGREVVREMNRIGMLVDLSHVAPSTMRDALKVSSAPVIFSHSSCIAVNNHPRNIPDDVLSQLPANGGVAMVTFVPGFISAAVTAWDEQLKAAMTAAGQNFLDLGQRGRFAEAWDAPPKPTATVADVVAHVEHAREVAGIDHIGLGGDYDGVGTLPDGLEDVSKYPVLFAALMERGWSDEECAKLAGRNTLRVLRDTELTH